MVDFVITADGLKMSIIPLGDRALVIQLPLQHENKPLWQQSAAIAEVLREARQSWIVDVVPAYTTVTVVYNPLKRLYEDAAAEVLAMVQGHIKPAEAPLEPRMIEIPVYYGNMHGPDLPQCAERAGMSEAAFIKRHSEAVYQVAMIGFMPGFPYLTGLPAELSQPRRSSPRSLVPAGAVGIAGGQTGVYPLATPGAGS
nr:5-oxoprolinase subunit PxpB [Paenibacillus albus]